MCCFAFMQLRDSDGNETKMALREDTTFAKIMKVSLSPTHSLYTLGLPRPPSLSAA